MADEVASTPVRSAVKVKNPPIKMTAKAAWFPVPFVLIGILVACWFSFGRAAFGMAGSLTVLYTLTIGFLVGVLHVFWAIQAARTVAAGRKLRGWTWATIIVSWVCGVALGYTIPDLVDGELMTLMSGTDPVLLDLAIGLCNPAGIICVTSLIISLVIARRDARGDKVYDEDAVIDALEG